MCVYIYIYIYIVLVVAAVVLSLFSCVVLSLDVLVLAIPASHAIMTIITHII